MRKVLLFTLCLAGFAATNAKADEADAWAPTFYVEADGGYSVYKSALVQSNDTGVTVGYGFGAYAGKSHDLGLALKREQSAFSFALNNSKLAVSWQDFLLTYRLGYFHAGVTISSSAWQVSAPPDTDGDGQLDTGTAAVAQDLLDITTTGYGGTVGFQGTLGKKSSVFTDVTFVTTGAVQEKVVKDAAGSARLDRVITLGPRMDVDLGGTLKLWKWLDLKAGFKYRTYSLTIDGTASKESLNTTYGGLVADFGF
jgi:hypothetical protein